MKMFKNNKMAIFSTIMLIVAFVVCSVSVSTVHASEMSKKNINHSHHENKRHDDGTMNHLSEHHLLSQPDQINVLNVVLPTALNDEFNEQVLTGINANKIEIINNQGAPPLMESLKTGIINTKSW